MFLNIYAGKYFFFIELVVPQGTELKIVGLYLRHVWKRFKKYTSDMLKIII